MKRHAAMLACLVGLLCLAFASSATAKSDAQCDGNRVLVQMGSSVDLNGDGYVCNKHNDKPQDNKVRIASSSTGATQCPVGSGVEPGNEKSTADKNANGIVCVNRSTGQVSDDDPTAPAGQPVTTSGSGACPSGFAADVAVGSVEGGTVDRNGNGVVCREPSSSTVTDDA